MSASTEVTSSELDAIQRLAKVCTTISEIREELRRVGDPEGTIYTFTDKASLAADVASLYGIVERLEG